MKKHSRIFMVVFLGIMVGITLFLGLTPLGYIQVGPVGLTTVQLPTILAALIGGPIAGIVVGGFFGLTSFINAFLYPSVISSAFFNPLISIFPRICVGIISAYLFIMLRKKSLHLAAYLSAAFGTLVNSFLVLGGLFLLYSPMLEKIAPSAYIAVTTIFITNSIPELVITTMLIPPLVIILYPRFKKRMEQS